MAQKTLDELYEEEIKDLYDAENRLVKTLPKLAEASTSTDLRDAFTNHLQKTQDHVRRLEEIFNRLGKKPSSKTCDGIKGIISEGSDAFGLDPGPSRDAMLIGGAQRAEHYEIAAYGTVKTWAEQLGRREDVSLLTETLNEEKEADRTLSGIAERKVNVDAQREGMAVKQ
jgi:ferritin-like metal-binding protein YciE